jgi:hypothetical protein
MHHARRALHLRKERQRVCDWKQYLDQSTILTLSIEEKGSHRQKYSKTKEHDSHVRKHGERGGNVVGVSE